MGRYRFFTLFIIFLAFKVCHAKYPFYSLSLTPSADTILAGTSIIITATVKDSLGTEYPSYESSVRWIVYDSLHDGTISSVTGKNVTFTAMKAYHIDTIRAMVMILPISSYKAQSIITILPNRAYQVHIEKDSIPASLWHTDSTDTVRITSYSYMLHLFAIERDSFGNYIGIARNASWAPLRGGIILVSSDSIKKGVAKISAIDSGICPLAVMDSGLVADTVYIYVTSRPLVSVAIPIRIKKDNSNNIPEIYSLSGRKLGGQIKGISGVYILKNGFLCTRKARLAECRARDRYYRLMGH